jgi:hypothetical protein
MPLRVVHAIPSVKERVSSSYILRNFIKACMISFIIFSQKVKSKE